MTFRTVIIFVHDRYDVVLFRERKDVKQDAQACSAALALKKVCRATNKEVVSTFWGTMTLKLILTEDVEETAKDAPKDRIKLAEVRHIIIDSPALDGSLQRMRMDIDLATCNSRLRARIAMQKDGGGDNDADGNNNAGGDRIADGESNENDDKEGNDDENGHGEKVDIAVDDWVTPASGDTMDWNRLLHILIGLSGYAEHFVTE